MHYKKTYINKANTTAGFNGDFDDELKKTVLGLEEEIENKLADSLKINSIISGNNSLKIRIKDEERMIQRIINCVFRFDNEDKWFGNCHIEFMTTELSEKPRLYYVGKFKITDRESINDKILRDLVRKVEEIY